MDTSFQKFIEITKIDDEERMVFGYASTPTLDSQGEVVSLEAIKGALPEYMRFPTIREMHTTNAVGTTKTAQVDDRGLFIGAKVVDDNAWKKVKEGVFRGFSIGGRIKQKIDETIQSLALTEISLVDVPANREAVITLFKSDSTNKNDIVKVGIDYKDQYLKMLSKYTLELKKEVNNVAKKDDKKEVEEIVEETIEETVVEEEATEEVVVEEAVVAETEEEETEEEAVEDDAEDAVEDDADDSTDGVVVDEAKQVSEQIADLEKIESKISKLDTPKEEVKVEKFDNNRMLKAFDRVVDYIGQLEDRIAKVEGEPKPIKTKASFLVAKGESTEAINPELVKAEAELADLVKIRDSDTDRYARENMSKQAFALMDRIKALKQG